MSAEDRLHVVGTKVKVRLHLEKIDKTGDEPVVIEDKLVSEHTFAVAEPKGD